VIEFLFIYYLFHTPNTIKYETKKEKLKGIAAWKDISLDTSKWEIESLKTGIGSIGTFYMTSKFHELSYLLYVGEYIKEQSLEERKNILNNHKKLKETLEKIREESIGKKVQMQNVLLHLLFPEYFERISSWTHKNNIARAFAPKLKDVETDDLDEQLWLIREKLSSEYGDAFDFYQQEIEGFWHPKREKTKSIKPKNNPIPHTTSLDIEKDQVIETSLHFEDVELLVERIVTVIQEGKHIILMGPPGTGKSKLASKIAEMFNISSVMTTASSNWSTYETIGGYKLNKDGNLHFNPGIFLNCVKN